ncbi:peptidylprolyl isomerase [soil metagenome]
MRRTIRLALIFTAVAALSACGPSEKVDKPPVAGDRAVAKIGDSIIWASDVKREALAEGIIGEGEPLDVSSSLFDQVLNQVIDHKLLAAEALKRKLDQDPASQRRLAAARERILGDMLVESVVEKAVNENAIRGLYQEQLKTRPSSEEYHARQIITATKEEAETVKRQASQADAAFDKLAVQHSIDPATRFDGGDLGYFALDSMSEAYGALKDAKIGDVVGPFQTEAGWAVVKVEDKRPEAPISMDAAKPQIVRFLTLAEVRELLENVRKGAKVKMLIEPAKDVPGAQREPASAPLAPATPLAPGAKAVPPIATPAPAPAPAAPAAKPAAKK